MAANRSRSVGERASAPQASAGQTPSLSISREKVCHIAFKAREFDAKDLPTFPSEGSNPADDGERQVLEHRPTDTVVRELVTFISALNFDEQVDLVTLAWVGRGDGTIADWAELRDLSRSRYNHRTPRYLLGMPLLGDYLSEGLAQFGYSCGEFANEHLAG